MGILDEIAMTGVKLVAYGSRGCQSRYLAGSVSQEGRWRQKGEGRVRESTEGVAGGLELPGVGAAASAGGRVRTRGHD